MFYLTKFRFMHKHDSLSLYQTLAIKKIKTKTKQRNKNHKPSSLVQNNENAKDESTVLL